MNKSKTKKVDAVDLGPACFAYCGDPEETRSWKLPIHFPNSQQKTVNHIKNSLTRFDETDIPQSERRTVWQIIVGAAKAHGLRVEPRTFEENESVSAPPVGALPLQLEVRAVEVQLRNDLRDIAKIIPNPEQRVDAMLKTLRTL